MNFYRSELFSASLILAALLLLGARPAAAQYGTLNLQSGDFVTVTSTGTQSNRPGGTNATTSYDAGDNFYGVDAEAGSVFGLAGGTISGEDGDSAIFTSGAIFNMTSGFVTAQGSGTDGLDAANGSNATIQGGSFTASGSGANITPAEIGLSVTPAPQFAGPPLSAVDLYVDSHSLVAVSGGHFTASGTGVVGLYAINSGVIDLFGSGFTVNGNPVTGPLTSGSGTISGTLKNGDALNNLSYTVLGGTIEFSANAVPEASTTQSFGLLLVLGLGGWCLMAQRRSRGSVRK